VCASVCVTCRVVEVYVGSEQLVGYLQRTPSRRDLPSDLALTGAVCCPACGQPPTPFSFSHASAANNIDVATQGISNGHSL